MSFERMWRQDNLDYLFDISSARVHKNVTKIFDGVKEKFVDKINMSSDLNFLSQRNWILINGDTITS